MKTYTIIAGVNGTGKSSLAGVLRQQSHDLGVIIDVNRLAAANNGNNIVADRLAVARIRDCLSRDISFTQETTLSGSLTAHTARSAKERGYVIRMYYVGLDSVEESLTRIANRVRKGGHGIPEEDVRRRFGNRVKSLAAVLPYCDEAIFYDNNNGFAAVGEYRNGMIICYEGGPQWIREFSELLNQP